MNSMIQGLSRIGNILPQANSSEFPPQESKPIVEGAPKAERADSFQMVEGPGNSSRKTLSESTVLHGLRIPAGSDLTYDAAGTLVEISIHESCELSANIEVRTAGASIKVRTYPHFKELSVQAYDLRFHGNPATTIQLTRNNGQKAGVVTQATYDVRAARSLGKITQQIPAGVRAYYDVDKGHVSVIFPALDRAKRTGPLEFVTPAGTFDIERGIAFHANGAVRNAHYVGDPPSVERAKFFDDGTKEHVIAGRELSFGEFRARPGALVGYYKGGAVRFMSALSQGMYAGASLTQASFYQNGALKSAILASDLPHKGVVILRDTFVAINKQGNITEASIAPAAVATNIGQVRCPRGKVEFWSQGGMKMCGKSTKFHQNGNIAALFKPYSENYTVGERSIRSHPNRMVSWHPNGAVKSLVPLAGPREEPTRIFFDEQGAVDRESGMFWSWRDENRWMVLGLKDYEATRIEE